ncbi:tetratricopeptide repeat protein, partial [Streptosporangium sp. NPDC020072]|uniref:tetratricopeptide repeat protein n=1 Tax=Streptosporangium sp. NPDC020072 TaxID=3154788 RepID=UPI0034431674
NNLSIRLGDLGRREEGLTAIEEATAIYRKLARTHPDAHLPDLATSLNNLSIRLGDLGRREEGLTAIEEAVAICQGLAKAWPAVYQAELEQSLAVMEWLRGT